LSLFYYIGYLSLPHPIHRYKPVTTSPPTRQPPEATIADYFPFKPTFTTPTPTHIPGRYTPITIYCLVQLPCLPISHFSLCHTTFPFNTNHTPLPLIPHPTSHISTITFQSHLNNIATTSSPCFYSACHTSPSFLNCQTTSHPFLNHYTSCILHFSQNIYHLLIHSLKPHLLLPKPLHFPPSTPYHTNTNTPFTCIPLINQTNTVLQTPLTLSIHSPKLL